jgi:hypothetical protein
MTTKPTATATPDPNRRRTVPDRLLARFRRGAATVNTEALRELRNRESHAVVITRARR